MKKKKVWIITAALLAAAGAAGFYLYHQREDRQEANRLPEEMSFLGDVVSATGLTGVGMREEAWELGFLTDGLYVEEAYLNVGDEVEAHTPVFSVSQDSLKSARRELEKEVQETQLNRRQGEITFETGMVDVQKEKDLAAADASYAQTVYDNAVKSAQSEVDSLQEQVDDAQEIVDEYTASIEEDYYYTYYKVGELETTWKDHAAFLLELYENWDVDSLESVFGGSGGKNGIGYVTNQITKASSSGSASGTSGTSSGSGGQSGSTSQSGGSAPAGVSFSQTQVMSHTESGENPEIPGEDTNAGAGSMEAEADDTGENTETEGSTAAESGTEDENDSGENGTEEGAVDESENESEHGGTEKGEQSQGGRPSGDFSGGSKMGAGGKNVNVGDNEIKYNIYLAMVEEADESEAAYKAALENYEAAKAKAAAGIEQAKSELAVLKAQLEEQKLTCEHALIEAKKEYDLAVSNSENAQMVYDSAVKQLEEELEALKEAEETAAENLALFEASIGDGTFYTGAQGTVVMNNVRSGSWLTEDTVILAYSNPETVSVAAGVDQADIASVSIGDEACVAVSGYGSFTGKVTSLNPVSSSGGSSSVTYTVNIVLEGDISVLESNLTAYVYFGLTEEEKERLDSSGQGDRQQGADGEGTGGTMPEGGTGGGFGDNRSGMQEGGPR